MQPNYSSIGQIFSAQALYSVPLFQRPYVWNKEEQWQPLWDDVRALADRVLDPPTHKPVGRYPPISGHKWLSLALQHLPVIAEWNTGRNGGSERRNRRVPLFHSLGAERRNWMTKRRPPPDRSPPVASSGR